MSPISSSSPSQAMVLAPSPPPTQNLMYKNDLNCYCQKVNIFPVYQATTEGYDHALRFRSTVSVGKRSFTSPNTFSNRKSAEQDAAKLALEHLLGEDEANAANLGLYLRKENTSHAWPDSEWRALKLVCQDKARCKMILNEFLTKTKMECIYETVQVKMPPVFVSSLTLNGFCYKGEACKNKKEAEKLAALAAILSLVDDPTYGASVSEIMKSNFNVSAAFYETKDIPDTHDSSITGNELKVSTSNSDLTPLYQQNSSSEPRSCRILVNGKMPTFVDLQANDIEEQRSSEILVNKNKQDLVKSLPQTEKQGGHGVLDGKRDGAGLPIEAATISRRSYVNPLITRPLFSAPQQVIKLSEAAPSASQQISLLIDFEPQAAASDPANDPIASKKRKKNKKEADRKKRNKRLRTENKSDSSGCREDHRCEG